MKAQSKKQNFYPGNLSLEDLKFKFNLDEYEYSDGEIKQLCELLYKLAKIYHLHYSTSIKTAAKIVPLTIQTYDTEESYSICSGEYRRAS